MSGAVGSMEKEIVNYIWKSAGLGAQAWILNWILKKNVNPEESTRGHPDILVLGKIVKDLGLGTKITG